MHLTYIFDPLCGWCYGAHPALEKLAAIKGNTISLAPSGLFSGIGARKMDRHFAAYAWQNDQRIARLTGQDFTEAYQAKVLNQPDGIFDSEPATLAIIATGLNHPESEIAVLKLLQHARYVEGRDTCDIEVVASLLDQAGFQEEAARVRFPDDALIGAYENRLSNARREMGAFGASGVPSIILDHNGQRSLLPSQLLYGAFDQLIAHVNAA